MNIVIRKAKREDCTRIRELVYELAIYERAPHEITVSQFHFEESGFGERPVWWGYVVEIDGNIEAFALYYIRFSTWKGQRMYLEDILVSEKMRGMKIGELLFEKLILEAKEKKLNGIVWQVLSWNEPAIGFYKKFNAKFDNEWLNGAIDF